MISVHELTRHFGIAVGSDEAARLIAQIPGCKLQHRPSDGSQYAISKASGIDLLFCDASDETRRTSPETRRFRCFFLFAQGVDGHEAFQGELPLAFLMTENRDTLRQKATPAQSWVIGKGSVDLLYPDPDWDRWLCDDFCITASYRNDGSLRDFLIAPID